LAILGQVLIQLTLVQQSSDARVINIAGRQRMLSQRLTKAVLAIEFATNDVERAAREEELQSVIALWESSHQGLQNSSEELELPGTNSPEVTQLFADIEPHFQIMRDAANCLIANGQAASSCDSDSLQLVGNILASEPTFLEGMDEIVFQYDREATARVEQLKTMELILFSITLFVLLLEAFLVFRPAIRKIHQTLAELGQFQQELEQTLGQVEQRVEARTRDLQTVADVNRQISTILDADRLLQDVVDLTKERFRLYHSHIYLVDESGETLVLTSGAGHVGRKMVSEGRTIARDNQQSIVARSATTRKFVTVQDVTQSPTFLPHPLLPDTRSELAMPLVARGQLLGVLDVQSDVVNYFDGDVIGVIEILADQVASALSNAQLYEVAERTSRHERALGNFDRHIQGASDVDEILRVAVRELGKASPVRHIGIYLRVNT